MIDFSSGLQLSNTCLDSPMHRSFADTVAPFHTQRRLMTAVEDFINEGAAPAERMIRDLVACEHAYINTDHPSFVGGNRAIAQVQCCCPLHPCVSTWWSRGDKRQSCQAAEVSANLTDTL